MAQSRGRVFRSNQLMMLLVLALKGFLAAFRAAVGFLGPPSTLEAKSSCDFKVRQPEPPK
jgi:hypothetical protein